jgi:hypothetical protein
MGSFRIVRPPTISLAAENAAGTEEIRDSKRGTAVADVASAEWGLFAEKFSGGKGMSHMRGTNRAVRADGGMIFATATMMVAGVFQVLMGIVALVNDEFFFAVRSGYTFRFGVYRWGIVHLAVGAVLLLTALTLLTGSRWARAIGIAVAALAAIENFFFIPYYPIWTLLLIALDIFVIWALATAPTAELAHGGPRMMEAGGQSDRWMSTNQQQPGYNASEPGGGRRASDQSAQARGDGQREQQQQQSGSGSMRQPGS